jgi:hypothetical protein
MQARIRFTTAASDDVWQSLPTPLLFTIGLILLAHVVTNVYYHFFIRRRRR